MGKARVFGSYRGLHVNEDPSPCYNDGHDCENRNQDCHSNCEKYIEWSKKHQALKKVLDEARNKEGRIDSYNIDRAYKARKEYMKK